MKTIPILKQLAHSQHLHNIFDDFLNMSVAALSMQRDEDRYLERAKKYKPDDLKLFGNALGALMMDYEERSIDGNWHDCIGNIFEELELSNSRTGQFFTPESLCNLIAEITNSAIKKGTVNDPSTGSSRNLIAHSRLDPQNRFNFTYIGQDLDERCCLMSVINFVMYGMKGVVIHCNTLTMEIYKGWRIYMPETGWMVAPITASECAQFLTTQKEIEEQKQQPIINIPSTFGEQMKLF
ncbi:MAG: hypothetical protein FGM14_15105 [Flavobacteriales bacterium]|nr:hypothetical protein [Flavobacteriales bacterium]